MIRSPQELTESIRNAVNRQAVLFSHLLLAVTVAIHTYLAPESTAVEQYVAIGFSICLAGLLLLRVFDLASVNNRPRLYLSIYFITSSIAYILVSAPSTPYVAAWFLLVYLTNLYYGSEGVMFTVLVFGFTSLAKYIYLDNTYPMDFNDRANLIVAFLVFVAVCSIFSNVQKVFDWDRQRLHDTTKKAVLEGKRLRALINNMTESVLVLDESGKIKLYNAAALALFDTNANLEGKSIEDIASFKDDKGNPVTLKDLLPTGQTPLSRSDIQLVYSEEDMASLSLIATPLQTSYGHEDDDTGFIVTMRDITREKSLEDERNEFISVISHELRTPVTVTEASISNSMVVNEKNGNNEKIGQSLKLAHDQAIFLANMLNDLSTFARAEKGTLELDLESFSPGELTVQLENDYRREAEAKGMHIKAAVDENTPGTIASNRLYLREILQNFITNAIKYSDQGTVTVRVSAFKDGVKFDVTDEGIGISTSDQKKVFDKFFRSEDFNTRSRNGTGLGLYIVKKLAKIIQASFDLSSEIGKGSTFSVIVPDLSSRLAEHHPKAEIAAEPETPDPAEAPHPAAPAKAAAAAQK